MRECWSSGWFPYRKTEGRPRPSSERPGRLPSSRGGGTVLPGPSEGVRLPAPSFQTRGSNAERINVRCFKPPRPRSPVAAAMGPEHRRLRVTPPATTFCRGSTRVSDVKPGGAGKGRPFHLGWTAWVWRWGGGRGAWAGRVCPGVLSQTTRRAAPPRPLQRGTRPCHPSVFLCVGTPDAPPRGTGCPEPSQSYGCGREDGGTVHPLCPQNKRYGQHPRWHEGWMTFALHVPADIGLVLMVH